MQQVLIMMAAITPTEVLMEELEESIKEWKIFKDEERLKAVVFNSRLILLKDITKGDMNGAMAVMGDFDKLNKYRDMFEKKEN